MKKKTWRLCIISITTLLYIPSDLYALPTLFECMTCIAFSTLACSHVYHEEQLDLQKKAISLVRIKLKNHDAIFLNHKDALETHSQSLDNHANALRQIKRENKHLSPLPAELTTPYMLNRHRHHD